MTAERGQQGAERRCCAALRCLGPVLAAAMFVLSFGGSPASAQTSFEVIPGKVEAAIRPGVVERRAFEVVNKGAATLTIDTALVDCRVSEQGVVTLSDPGRASDSCASWITLTGAPVSVPPGSQRKVELTIQVPEGTPTGEYRAAVLFEPRPPLSSPNGFAINGRIAAQFVATVGGEQSMYRPLWPDPRILAALAATCLFSGVGLLWLDRRRRLVVDEPRDG